jgi:hypothetical protein
MDMGDKMVLVVGAGATLCDALRLNEGSRPPLDKGFFRNAKRARAGALDTVSKYLKGTYHYDPLQTNRDSLEAVMSMIYADLHNPALAQSALTTFRTLIRLLNSRIAETTNHLAPTKGFKLYRILRKMLVEGMAPRDITVITFNQDIQIEKILHQLQSTPSLQKYGRVFNFPFCYHLPASAIVSTPVGARAMFPVGNQGEIAISILKLHGSLNWFSVHRSRDIPKNSILDTERPIRITPRLEISPDMTFMKQRRMYTWPVVIPPVAHKAGILHRSLQPVWQRAEEALMTATSVVVFGYSCPETDVESANLLRRSIQRNTEVQFFDIIDPDPRVFQRYADLTALKKLFYFRNADAWLAY